MPRRRFPRVFVLLAFVAVLATAVVLGVPALGHWLLVADPLVPSDAIFVLDGRTPSREVEAAALYHRGLAPVILLTHARDPQEVPRRIARQPSPQATARAVLVATGVPDRAIVELTPVASNTAEELAIIAETARGRGFRRVILVTSPSHTRRVRMIWNAQRDAAPALIHPTAFETWDASRWWRSRHGVQAMVYELGGMLNFKLGTLLPTFDPESR